MLEIEEAFEEAAKARDEVGFIGTVADCIRYLDAELRAALDGAPRETVAIDSSGGAPPVLMELRSCTQCGMSDSHAFGCPAAGA